MTSVAVDNNTQINLSAVSPLDKARQLLEAIVDDASFERFVAHSEIHREIAEVDGDWLNLIGAAIGNPVHKYQNNGAQHAYWTRAAKKGNLFAQYNLGVSWARGYFGKVDKSRARYWFERIANEHMGASTALANLSMGDPQYLRDRVFTAAVHRRLIEGMAAGAPPSTLETAYLWSSGEIGRRNPQRSIELYKRLLDFPNPVPPKLAACQNLATRYMVGLDAEQDLAAAKSALDHVRDSAVGGNSAQVQAHTADRSRFVIEHWCAETALAFGLVRDVYLKAITVDELFARTEAWTGKTAEMLCEAVRHVSTLASSERWPDSRMWSALSDQVQLRYFGADEFMLQESLRQRGPLYNEDDEHGVTKPGVYRKAECAFPGFGVFRGFEARKNGEIDFHFDAPTKGAAPWVLPEDVDTALTLAFGLSTGPVWPSLSIEPLAPRSPERPQWSLTEKIWEPDWLGRTSMGETFYEADRLMGDVAWRTAIFNTRELSEGNGSASPALTGVVSSILELGGRAAGLAMRIMIKPETFYRSWKPGNGGSHFCYVHAMRMAVDGSAIGFDKTGAEDRKLNINDERFAGGRLGLYLTKNYDQLAELWPIFERTRQLTALVKALNELRSQDFVLSPSLRARVVANLTSHQSTPALTRAQKLVL